MRPWKSRTSTTSESSVSASARWVATSVSGSYRAPASLVVIPALAAVSLAYHEIAGRRHDVGVGLWSRHVQVKKNSAIGC